MLQGDPNRDSGLQLAEPSFQGKDGAGRFLLPKRARVLEVALRSSGVLEIRESRGSIFLGNDITPFLTF